MLKIWKSASLLPKFQGGGGDGGNEITSNRAIQQHLLTAGHVAFEGGDLQPLGFPWLPFPPHHWLLLPRSAGSPSLLWFSPPVPVSGCEAWQGGASCSAGGAHGTVQQGSLQLRR